MPFTPSGGLSIFINLVILIVGTFLKFLKKIGLSILGFAFLYKFFTQKNFDSLARRVMGYGLFTALFIIMSVTTSYSIYQRLNVDSNIDLVKESVNKIVTIYKEKTIKKVEKEKILQYPININNLAINILK